MQTWLDVALMARTEMPLNIPCHSLCTSQHISHVCVSNPPPLLVIEVSPGTVPTPVPCAILNVPCLRKQESYALWGVIYLWHFHFTARLIDNHDQIWTYDGKKKWRNTLERQQLCIHKWKYTVGFTDGVGWTICLSVYLCTCVWLRHHLYLYQGLCKLDHRSNTRGEFLSQPQIFKFLKIVPEQEAKIIGLCAISIIPTPY